MTRQRMVFFRIATAAFVLGAGVAGIFGQTKGVPPKTKDKAADRRVQQSPAYAEVVLRETELRSDLEGMLTQYTDEHPKVKELHFSLGEIERAKALLLAVKPEDSGVLTLALGKLLVRRVDAATNLWRVKQSLADNHPDVKRAQRRLDVYEKAIGEILN